MEDQFKELAGVVALGVEAAAAAIIVFGAVQALVRIAASLFKPLVAGHRIIGERKAIWQGFGVWLLLGLEFELAADIVRTAISPSWTDIGQLAAIAAIRTFLNYFLEKDIERYTTDSRERVGEATVG